MAKKRVVAKAQKAKRRRKQDHARWLGHGPKLKRIRDHGPFDALAAASTFALAMLLMKKKPKGPEK